MSEGLEVLWSKLSLTEDEQSDDIVKKEWLDDQEEVKQNCLLGKLMTRKNVNVEAMNSVFIKIWKISYGLSIREVGDRLFLFHFEDILERDRILQKQPWSFNKSLMVLKEIDGNKQLEEVNMDWCPFRVQIHGLPLGLMNEKIGTVLGDAIGDLEEVEVDDGQFAWGKYLKVRVSIKVMKPLK